MNLKKCSIDNTDQIIEIGRKTYFETFHSMNTEKTMSLYLEEAFSREKIQEEISNKNSYFYLLFHENKMAGYMKINFPPAQTDINDKDSLELERIYLKSSYKGKGFGKFMMDYVFETAENNRCKYVWLGVWEKNKKAIAFYKKCGFKIFATHKFRMGEELQNDYLLKKEL